MGILWTPRHRPPAHRRTAFQCRPRIEVAYGPLDILFNNAGIAQSYQGPIEAHPTSNYQTTMKINSEGVYLGIKHAAESMKKRSKDVKESASIVNVSSVAGLSGNAGPFECGLDKGTWRGKSRC